MTDIAAPAAAATAVAGPRPHLDAPPSSLATIIFFGAIAAGFLFVAYSLYVDVSETGMKTTTYLPYLLLFVALVIALGFEFVNGFHDTANAVATVIYTHSMPAPVAVVWSGCFNLLGVLVSTGKSEMIPNATAPEETSTPSRLKQPDHTTANGAGMECV